MNEALIVVDQQIDFQPGGALAVAGGDEIVPRIIEMMPKFETIIFTQDSHPKNHISFASSYEGRKPFEVMTLADVREARVESKYFSKSQIENYLKTTSTQSQVLWPDHCLVGTEGWKFDPRLPAERAHLILRKGTRVDCDSYSAFFENDGSSTGLSGFLRSRGISKVVVAGLAGDYCVYWTAKDARNEGFEVDYIKELTRFVNFPAHSAETALADLKAQKVQIV